MSSTPLLFPYTDDDDDGPASFPLTSSSSVSPFKQPQAARKMLSLPASPNHYLAQCLRASDRKSSSSSDLSIRLRSFSSSSSLEAISFTDECERVRFSASTPEDLRQMVWDNRDPECSDLMQMHLFFRSSLYAMICKRLSVQPIRPGLVFNFSITIPSSFPEATRREFVEQMARIGWAGPSKVEFALHCGAEDTNRLLVRYVI